MSVAPRPAEPLLQPLAPPIRVSPDGLIRSWNTALASLWGRTEAQALGLGLSELCLPLEPSDLPPLSDVVPRRSWHGSVALRPADGGVPRCHVVQLRATAEGSLELEVCASPPGSEASTASTGDAHGAQQRLAALFDHLPGFCYTVNRELVFTSSEGAGLSGLGLRPGQVVGTSLFELWGTRDPSYAPLLCHLRALAGFPTTYTDFCMGRSLEYHLSPLRDPEGKVIGLIGVGFDVSERELAREQQQKLTAQLRQAQKLEAVGRLAGGVAHDFNNFLTCIMGNLCLLEDQLKPGPSGALYLAEANSALDSAASLTRQLLAFSRKQVISPRPLNLSTLVQRLVGILERLLGERIQLRTECDPELWSVMADPGQIEQVLVNLVTNARDAIGEDGEVLIQTRNVVVTHPERSVPERLRAGSYVVLTVRDSGRGLSDVVRSRLFEPFFTTKETGEGTGLGLATVYGAVEQNGGAIRVDSALGKGSSFEVFLPRADAESVQPSGEPEAASPAAQLHGGTETILLVEDEPSVLEVAHLTLSQLGYNVLPCAGPDEALRVFGDYQSRIQLLITDVVMPRMNGKELASRVSALSPGVIVLFSSGYGENIISRHGVVQAGINFIAKPYRPRELARKVRELLDQRPDQPLQQPLHQPLHRK